MLEHTPLLVIWLPLVVQMQSQVQVQAEAEPQGETQKEELSFRAVNPDGAVDEVGIKELWINMVVKIKKAFVCCFGRDTFNCPGDRIHNCLSFVPFVVARAVDSFFEGIPGDKATGCSRRTQQRNVIEIEGGNPNAGQVCSNELTLQRLAVKKFLEQ